MRDLQDLFLNLRSIISGSIKDLLHNARLKLYRIKAKKRK